MPDIGLALISEYKGQFDKQVEESLLAYRKDASVQASYNLIEAYINLGRLDEAGKVLAESKARYPGNDQWARWGYALAFLRHDSSETKRILEAAPSGSTLQRTLLAFTSRTELYYGRQREAAEYRRRATQFARQTGIDERTSWWAALAALHYANCGNFTEAKRIADEACPAQGRTRC